MATISLQVNGKTHQVEVAPSTPLVFVLRDHLGLTGTKLGCGLEQCGACAVLVNGCSTLSCAAAATDFGGKSIITVEGLARDGQLSRVQKAFVDAGAAQCGYCIPGLVIATTALVASNPDADDDAINATLEPHLCRCGSHGRVLAAVRALVGRGGES